MNWPPAIDADALRLLAGVLAVLVTGSLAGYALRIGVARGRPHPVIDNVLARVRAWWLIAALVGLAFWFGRPGVVLLFAVAAYLALREFLPAPSDQAGDRVVWWSCLHVAVPVQFALVGLGGVGDWGGGLGALVWIPAFAFLILPALLLLSGDPRALPERLALPQWGLILCVFGVSCAPALLTLEIPGHAGRGGYLLMFLLLVTQLGDVFQYLAGKLCGRHALAPAVSPSKTVEGLLGGVAGAAALGAGLAWMTPFTVAQAAALALVVSLFGVFGGLLLSSIKRDRGVKDWGRLIAGHGGVLDRLDSLCLSAPVFGLLVWLGWAA